MMQRDLPRDPVMLLSVINTKLRDYYKDLDSLCQDLEIVKSDLIDKLSMIDYEYDSDKNQFL